MASYLHRTTADLPPQIGVLVAADAAGEAAREVAMHAAAMAPRYLDRDSVPAEVVTEERRIAEEKSREEGKPEQALPKIVEGRVNAFFKDYVLLEQPSRRTAPRAQAVALRGGCDRHRLRPVQGGVPDHRRMP